MKLFNNIKNLFQKGGGRSEDEYTEEYEEEYYDEEEEQYEEQPRRPRVRDISVDDVDEYDDVEEMDEPVQIKSVSGLEIRQEHIESFNATWEDEEEEEDESYATASFDIHTEVEEPKIYTSRRQGRYEDEEEPVSSYEEEEEQPRVVEDDGIVINHGNTLLGAVTKDKRQYYETLKKEITASDLELLDGVVRRANGMYEVMELLDAEGFNLHKLVALDFATEEDIQGFRLYQKSLMAEESPSEPEEDDYLSEVYASAKTHNEKPVEEVVVIDNYESEEVEDLEEKEPVSETADTVHYGEGIEEIDVQSEDVDDYSDSVQDMDNEQLDSVAVDTVEDETVVVEDESVTPELETSDTLSAWDEASEESFDYDFEGLVDEESFEDVSGFENVETFGVSETVGEVETFETFDEQPVSSSDAFVVREEVREEQIYEETVDEDTSYGEQVADDFSFGDTDDGVIEFVNNDGEPIDINDSPEDVKQKLLNIARRKRERDMEHERELFGMQSQETDYGFSLGDGTAFDTTMDVTTIADEYQERVLSPKLRKSKDLGTVVEKSANVRKIFIIFDGIERFPSIEGYDFVNLNKPLLLNEYMSSKENLLIVTTRVPQEIRVKFINWLKEASEDSEKYRIVTVDAHKVDHVLIEESLPSINKEELDSYFERHPIEDYMVKPDTSSGFIDLASILEGDF